MGHALVSSCDKLHNARCILADLREHGSAVWNRFTVADPDEQLWYYESLVGILSQKVRAPVADELARTVKAIRVEAEVAPP